MYVLLVKRGCTNWLRRENEIRPVDMKKQIYSELQENRKK